MLSPVSILGVGCVTAVGSDVGEIWQRMEAGERPKVGEIANPFGGEAAPIYRVPVPHDAGIGFPRLRRSSNISYFALAAAQAAVAQAGELDADRTALVFAASDGAVVYTRLFYAEMLRSGTGSPLLFPETVYNAASSHVAAYFGLDQPALTMIGDATAGTDALLTAAALLHDGGIDRCLVVAAEEADWLLCDAYRRWGLVSRGAAILSEGAAAILLGRAHAGPLRIEHQHRGASAHGKNPLRAALRGVVSDLCKEGPPDLAILSGAGTRIARIEQSVLRDLAPQALQVAPKHVVGEAFAASTLLQVIIAGHAITAGHASRVIVPVVGWSGQIGGVVLAKNETHGVQA